VSVSAREVPASPRRPVASLGGRPSRALLRRGASLLMATAMGFQLLGLAAPAAASTTAPSSPAAPAPEAAGTQTVTLASGAGISGTGVMDPNVTYQIAGGASGDAYTVAPQVSYGTPFPGSHWINTTGSTGCDQACGNGSGSLTTAYSMTFTLTAGYASPSISGQVYADDAATVYLNGNQIGQQPQNKNTKNYSSAGSFGTKSNQSSFFHLGTNTLTVSNVDFGGSNGVDFLATVTYTGDTTPPVATATATPAPNAAGWNKTDVTVSWTWTDTGGSGIDSANCTTSKTTNGEFGPPSGQTLTATCKDLAGNTGTSSYTVYGVDKTPPSISGSASPAPDTNGWNNSDVTVHFNCSDSLSGVASVSADKVLTGEGANQSATGTCTDVAGNSGSKTVSGINIDKTAPVTTANAPSGWSNTGVTVTLSASDNLSGVAATYYAVDGGAPQTGTSISIDTEGTYAITFWSVDKAGNTETPHTATVMIDKTAPTISHAQSPDPNANGWNNSDVTVTFTCLDALSGIASCGPTPQTVTTEGAAVPVTATAVDHAGNTQTTTAYVKLDKTPPTISGAPDRSANGAGWYSADVSVAFTCDDALSGIASCLGAATLGEGANQSVSGTATDAAGNTASTSVDGINIDETAPTITAAPTTAPNALGFYTGPVTVHFTCSDLLSGIAAGSCPADQVITSTGTSTAETVTDLAGNTSVPSNPVSVVIDTTPSATPLLVKAASGGNGGIAGLVQTPAGTDLSTVTTYDVTLYLAASCTGNLPGPTLELGTAAVALDSTGAGTFAINIASLPIGEYITATATDGFHLSSGYATCVEVGASNDSWPNALDITTSGGNSTGSGPSGAPGFSVDTPGQSRWFRFAVTPGEQLTINLAGLPADYDLALFKDIPAAYASLTSVADLNQLGANFAGQAFSAQAFSAQAFSAQAFSPDAYSGQAFSAQAFSADVYSAQAFSAQAFSGQAFSAQAFSAQAFSGQAFSAQAFSGQAFSAQAFSPQAFSAHAFSDTGYSAQAFSSTTYSAQAFSGQAFSPQAFSSAQVESLIAVSAASGTSPEQIDANTWNNTGYYYIRVTGKNGVFDPSTPFTLSVTRTGTSCDGIGSDFAPPADAAAGPNGGYKTIILTDSSRFADQADVATLNSTLTTFASRPEVNAKIIDVGDPASPFYGAFQTLNSQADTNYSCPYAKNLVASALKDIVDSYRAKNPLQYVVLVGGDNVVPFFRYPDEALLAPESGYIPPLKDTTASEASLALNYVLSQDAYGADALVNQNANLFPVPDLAVGRLVETAAEATTMLNAYLSTTGGVVATPTTSLVTGYDFLSDAASSVNASLTTGTGQAGDSLIAANNIAPTQGCDATHALPNCAWDATALKHKLLDSRHDLVFLAGHFSANSALAADFSTTMTTADLASSSTSFTNSIVFSAGCHSGYNIVNGDALPGITQPLDWSEAFAQKGATLIAGTGYQYGDTDFEMYSEQIYAGFASQLLVGSGPVSVGDALLQSKLAYLAANPTLRGIDTKALLEATLYGLPMLSVNMPDGRTTPAPDPSVVGSLADTSSGPGSQLGLQTTILDAQDSLTQHSQQLSNPDPNAASAPSATWYSGPSGVTSKPFEPTLPLDSKNVTVSGQSLRGVGLWAGTYADTTGITPLTGAATEDLRGVHTPFQSPVFYPMRLAYPNYFSSITDANGLTHLLVTPAQYKADATSGATSTQRLFSDLQLKLFYDNSIETRTVDGVTLTPALAAAPSILSVTATPSADGNSFTVDAQVIGDPSAGIQEVWVTYTAADGLWQSLDLQQDPLDSSHWSTTVGVPNGHSLSDVSFMVQAANGVGLVAVADNYGAYYSPLPPTSPDANTTTLTLASAPSHAAYGSTATFSATLSGGNDGNQPITFTLGALSKTTLTGADGTASADFQLTSQPATYPLSATFAGDQAELASTASRTFTVDKVSTTLTLTGPSQVLPGASSGIVATLTDGNGLPVGLRTVWFVVSGTGGTTGGWTTTVTTNYLGQATLGVIPLPAGSYTVAAYFEGTFELLPTSTTVTLTDSTYGESADSVPFSIIQVGTTTTISATSTGSNPTPQFSDTITLSATVTATVAGTPFSGAVQFTFNGHPVGSPVPVTDSTPTATLPVVLDGTVIPSGAGSYVAGATFTPAPGSAITGSSATTNVGVQAEGKASASLLDGSSRLDYTGDQFVNGGTAPRLSVVLRQSQSPESSDREYVDYSKQNIQVTLKLYPASCTTKGHTTTCAPSSYTSPAVRVANATDWSATGNGVASFTPPSTLATGAYVVVVSVTAGTAFIAPEVATSTLEVSPVGITAISGGGYVSPDSTSNAANPLGYFAFDTEKQNKGSVSGTMAYVYRARINTTTSTPTSLVTCTTLGSSCHDVDVIIRATGVTDLNGGQKGYTIGTVAVNFVDAASGTDYTGLDYVGGPFRIDIVDNSQQNQPSQFGFTAYLANGTTAFHQAYIPSSGAIDQTGMYTMTNETTVAGGFITSHP
jgi:hypothetical protein